MLTWLYLPNGCKVQFEFTGSSFADDDYKHAIEYTNGLLALGASVNAPGLEAGEEKDQVLGVVKRVFLDDEKGEIPVIDVFVKQDHLGLRWVFKYMNTADDIAEFENATGLKIADIPVFTQPSLNRHEKPQLAQTYLIPVKRQCSVVRAPNPAYDPNAAKKKMQFHLIRWESAGIPTPAPQPAAAQPPANPFAGQQQPAVQTTQNEPTGEPDMSTDALKDIWNIAPSGAQWSRLRKWLFTNVYENNQYAIDGSMAKHAKQTQNWKRGDGSQMTVGDIVRYLQTRHEGEKQGLQDAS